MSLFQTLATEANFAAAWQRVRSNLGAPGLDRVSLEDFEKNLHDNLALLRTMVAEGAYQPLPYLTFTHKKDSGKDRTLRIPTVRDRVVQQAILLVIQPRFEKIFLNCSYAYRPGRSSHDAIERVERNLKRGRVWVVDADIENFFDEIDRGLLMKFVGETLAEAPLLKLLELCINGSNQLPVISNQLSVASSQSSASGIQDQATSNEPPATSNEPPATSKGLAQGMGLAPLLSNVYLHKLDDRMFRAQWNYIRYSDNLLVLCHSEDEAKAALSRAEAGLRDLILKFNPEKTSLRHLRDGFSFLGFYFDERGKRPDEGAVQRLNQRLGSVMQKGAELAEAQLREKLESIVRGWLNYFKLSETDRAQLLVQLEQKFAADAGSMPQRILQAALAYQLGDKSRAGKILRAAPLLSSDDAEINLQWGVLCDLLEMKSEALDSYLAAYRHNPDHPESAYRLGLHYLQNHQNEPAIRYLQKAVQLQPSSAAAHFALGAALQNTGLNGVARKVLQRASQLDPRLHKLVAAASIRQPATSIQQPATSGQQPATDDDLAVFLRLFSGREGVFGRQWVSDSGRLGYNAVYQPLSKDDVKAHLNGQQTLGYYLMRTDNTVGQMIIDIDLTKQVRSDLASHDFAEWKNLLWAEALRIGQVMQELNLKAYIEDSGFKGLHLWLFFAAPTPARDVVLLAKKILALAGPAPPGLHREIFPNEPRIAPQALGALLKLPLGIHKLTNRRCWFLDNTGQPVADQFALLRNVELIAANQFLAALEKAKTTLSLDPAVKPVADRTEVNKIFQGCNVLRHFRDKAEKTKWLNHVERLSLAAVLGHMGEAGHQAVHDIIRHTTNYNLRITQKWLDRVKGYPLSCPRIRERHSDITPVVGCCCQFPQLKGSYPSPVLHADSERVIKIKARVAERESGKAGEREMGRSGETEIGRVSETSIGRSGETEMGKFPLTQSPSAPLPLSPIHLFQNYLQLKKQQREASQKVTEIEQQLQTLCDQHKTEQFVTEIGTFKKIKVEGEWRWVMEI
jgi:retron-type reverse transcriptase